MSKYELSEIDLPIVRLLLREEQQKQQRTADTLREMGEKYPEKRPLARPYQETADSCARVLKSLDNPLKPTRTDDPEYDSDKCYETGCVRIPTLINPHDGKTFCNIHAPSYTPMETIK